MHIKVPMMTPHACASAARDLGLTPLCVQNPHTTFTFYFFANKKMVACFAAALSHPFPAPAAVPPSTAPRLILLDRDGVVNEDVGAPGVTDPRQLCLTRGAGKAIGRLKRRGCHVSLITNQSCVGKGIISERELQTIHERLEEMLLWEDDDALLDDMFICTSTKQDNDRRMKPGPGMILEAKQKFEKESSSSSDSSCVFIGDTFTDMLAAKAGGVNLRVLVETGYGRGVMGNRNAPKTVPAQISSSDTLMEPDLAQVLPFVYANNLSGAVEWLLSGEDGNGGGGGPF